MFKPVSMAEEKQIQDSIRICLMPPESIEKNYYNSSNSLGCHNHTIYFYPGGSFNEGVTVFECTHILTRDSFIFDTIDLFGQETYDERELYYLVPFLIRISIKWARIAGKKKVILKSIMPHFAEHLINNRFRICKRVLKNHILIKGVKTI